MSGYKILSKGTKVGFVHKGYAVDGEVVSWDLDPNRKPGISRVTYVVKWHPAFQNVRVHASKVHLLEGKGPLQNKKAADELFELP